MYSSRPDDQGNSVYLVTRAPEVFAQLSIPEEPRVQLHLLGPEEFSDHLQQTDVCSGLVLLHQVELPHDCLAVMDSVCASGRPFPILLLRDRCARQKEERAGVLMACQAAHRCSLHECPRLNYRDGRTFYRQLESLLALRASFAPLNDREQFFRSLIEGNIDAVIMVNAVGGVEYMNPAARALLGERAGALLEHGFGIPLGENQRPTELTLLQKDGQVVTVDMRVSPITYRGNPVQLASLRDISERKRHEQEIRESAETLQQVTGSMNDAMVMVDESGRVVFWNPAAEHIFGSCAEQALGQKLGELILQPQEPETDDWLQRVLQGEQSADARKPRLAVEHPGRGLVSVELSVASCERLGKRHVVLVARDITDQVEHERQLHYLANHDQLTGLPNRAYVMRELEHLLQEQAEAGSVVLFFVDLADFRFVNEIYGHHIGDALLIQAAKRLQQPHAPGQLVARLAGNQFAVVLAGLKEDTQIREQADVVRCLLEEPYQVSTNSIQVDCRIGCSRYPRDADNAEALVKSASIALHWLREEQNGYFNLYDDVLSRQLLKRASTLAELRLAMEQDQFVLYFQPQVDIRSGALVGAEALIRWQHPVRGLVPPNDFIPLLESTELINQVGEWVIFKACEHNRLWGDLGLPIVPIHVNVSPRQFYTSDLVKVVKGALDRFCLRGNFLGVEITEGEIMKSHLQAVDTLVQLKEMGIPLAIDDFGTGYSSLSRLTSYPIDMVKIDRAFIKDIGENPDSAIIAITTIAMAEGLGLGVIAEGVETEAQLNYLQRHGCLQVQGYYFSPPVPSDQFEMLLQKDSWCDGADDSAVGSRLILIVDDEINVINSVSRLLRRENCRLLGATSAAEALDLMAQYPISVVISDLRMSEMSGIELLAKIREKYPDTIRMIMSGYTDLDTVTSSVNQGEIFKFISKPWEEEDLKNSINAAFIRYQENNKSLRLNNELNKLSLQRATK